MLRYRPTVKRVKAGFGPGLVAGHHLPTPGGINQVERLPRALYPGYILGREAPESLIPGLYLRKRLPSLIPGLYLRKEAPESLIPGYIPPREARGRHVHPVYTHHGRLEGGMYTLYIHTQGG